MLSLDVVVRTLADAQRSTTLFRALDSIQNQRGLNARPIVVVNGGLFDPCTLAALKERPGIILSQLSQASTADSMAEGLRLVQADFFAYLDDDDVLIADSLLMPVEWLESHKEHDVVVTNGHFVAEDGGYSEFIHIADHVRIGDAALSLLDDGWLAPGAFICRKKSISPNMLDPRWNQMEWTHLAFEISAANKKIHFMNWSTALYYNTPGSMSKDAAHLEALIDLMESVRSDRRMSTLVKNKANRKYHNALHMMAARYCREGNLRQAWRYHLRSMRPPYTFEYLLFSRKLLWPVARGSKGGPPST